MYLYHVELHPAKLVSNHDNREPETFQISCRKQKQSIAVHVIFEISNVQYNFSLFLDIRLISYYMVHRGFTFCTSFEFVFRKII